MDQHLIAAAVLQSEFHAEDRFLRAERAALQSEIFNCGICGEIYPKDYVARVTGCAHEFCRDCLRVYVVSKLAEEVLPTSCPRCVADNVSVESHGCITQDLVEMLGLTDEQYQVFRELEISPQRMYTFLECLKCKESVLIYRMGYETTTVLECPLPGCKHIWRKVCRATIADLAAAVEHQCAGTLSLQNVVRTEGWKCCPGKYKYIFNIFPMQHLHRPIYPSGCQTPYEKIEGSNHVQCLSPDCMTHFCYACGESIVRSTVPEEIAEAVTAHDARCGVLEYMPA
ncbi:hypothetical protein FB451DRAFT_792976 [Mycena latifolia]|nr:hypothetical protein FB451DRAFT_792976 [Mycena latifolia]